MKISIFSILFLLSFWTFISGSEPVVILHDTLKPSPFEFHVMDTKELIEKSYKDIIACAPSSDNLMTFYYNRNKNYKKRINYFIDQGSHPFIAAVYFSFAHHKKLTLSPDMIWLLICQGVSTHISLNSSEYQQYFSKRFEKEKLQVEVNKLTWNYNDTNWTTAINLLSDQLSQRIDSKLFSLYTPNFTTTSTPEKIAFQLTLMNTVKDYYEFYVATACGIPEIKLLGERKDWVWMYENVDQFTKLGLEEWVTVLKPILKNFVDAFEGNVDKSFWCNILTTKSISGGPLRITGWVKDFFPYVLNDRKRFVKNEYLGKEHKYNNPYSRDSESERQKYYEYHYKWKSTGLKIAQFSSGIQKTPFVWEYYNRKNKMIFYSGFIGVCYYHDTHMLVPKIGYLIGRD